MHQQGWMIVFDGCITKCTNDGVHQQWCEGWCDCYSLRCTNDGVHQQGWMIVFDGCITKCTNDGEHQPKSEV